MKVNPLVKRLGGFMMQLANFEFVQLTQNTPLLPFLSEDEDLNNFLTEDAKNYSADLMAVTYLFYPKGYRTHTEGTYLRTFVKKMHFFILFFFKLS